MPLANNASCLGAADFGSETQVGGSGEIERHARLATLFSRSGMATSIAFKNWEVCSKRESN